MEAENKKEDFKSSWWSFLFFGGFTLFCAYAEVWWGALLFGAFTFLTVPHKKTHEKVMEFMHGLWDVTKGLLSLGFFLLLIGGGIWLGSAVLGGIFGGSNDYNSAGVYQDSDYEDYEDTTLDYDEAIESHWDEIKDYVDGTEIVEACYEDGNCYDLDADISSGYLETLYFNNGGHLNFYAEFDENGYAYDTDDEYRDWEFTLSMNSSIVEDAVSDWASDNGYTIE